MWEIAPASRTINGNEFKPFTGPAEYRKGYVCRARCFKYVVYIYDVGFRLSRSSLHFWYFKKNAISQRNIYRKISENILKKIQSINIFPLHIVYFILYNVFKLFSVSDCNSKVAYEGSDE